MGRGAMSGTPSQKRASAFEIVFAVVVVGTLVGAFADWWPWQVLYLVALFGVGSGLLGGLLGLWSLDDLWSGGGVGDSNGFGGDGGGGDGGGGDGGGGIGF